MVGEFAALGAAVSWAVAPILYRQALSSVKPIYANVVRCASNALVLLLVLVVLGKAGVFTHLPMGAVALTAVSGVIGLGIGDTMYLIGLKSIGVSRAVPLAATYPLFSLAWSTFLIGQPLTLSALFGALSILLGIFLLSREKEKDTTLETKSRVFSRGVGLCLMTALVWSVSITLMDVAVKMPGANTADANFALITLRVAAISVLLLTLLPAISRGKAFPQIKRNAVIELCVGGLIANGIGWYLMNTSFLNIAEAQAVPISSTTPLFSAIAGFVLFHERFTYRSITGAIVIVLGVFLIFLT
jgi:drug/metabolite transporter (DMT)-like permease